MADVSVILTAVGVVSRETTIQDLVDTVLRLARPIGGESQ